MNALGIQVGVHYPVALPKLKAFEYLNIDSSKTFYGQSDHELLSLPIGDHISSNEIDKIVEVIANIT
jgi:dTDP-4-amino-4,6-dideoxygalactose transaminase